MRSVVIVTSLLFVALGLSGLVFARGLHDNDWPLLMWLAHHASFADPSSLAIGHYPPGQLLLVRFTGPLFGSTVVAAKLFNAAAAAISAALVFRIAAHVSGNKWIGWIAFITFATSTELLLTGQAEFGDPLALCAFLFGLDRALTSDAPKQWLIAGVAFGLGGAFRTHMQTFAIASIATLLCTGLANPRRALAIITGFVIASAPLFVLNLKVHGQLSSPTVSSFVGQVLFGYDDYDLARTYNRFPMNVVLRDHMGALITLIHDRLLAFPGRWLVWLVACAAALITRKKLALYLLLLATGYYVGVVCPAWSMTPRLLLPFAALLAILAPVALSELPPKVGLMALVVLFVTIGVRVVINVRDVRHDLKHVRAMHAKAERLTTELRSRGLHDAREAFVFDWNRWLTDEPRAITFYNFGFWNLLNPAFARERPNPIDTVNDPAAFSAFMQAQNVRFIVLQMGSDRFKALEAGIPGYERVADLGEDVIFVRSGL